MIKLKSLIFIVLILPIFIVSAGALEIQAGRVRLVLYEQTGRFNLYYKAAETEYLPFLSEQNTSSSFVTIVIGNKVHILGTSPGYEQLTEETPLGARFTWSETGKKITESFSFI